MTETIVPDTSIIVDGKLTDLIRQGDLADVEIVVPEAVIDELESQANKGREIGYAGLDELQDLQELTADYPIEVRQTGRRPTGDEIERAKEGSVDALIRDVAKDLDATLYTADFIQHRVAKATDVKVRYFEKQEDVEFSIRDYFEDDIMSVHLKQGDVPKAKRGKPGNLTYEPIGTETLEKRDLERLMKEVIETAESADSGLVEMDMDGATVVQIGDLRISMTQPPFSEAREITAVRPIVKVGLDDYDLSDKLKTRLLENAEGILISGAPGHGKSTFAQALAERYSESGRVVKTMEHPRDLQVGSDITQYAKLEGEMENTGDLLLLVRPDYTVYDEVRKTEDFEVFSDMRLAGVGMLGVVHASDALDAIQRLIGRVELGVIPQIVDTVVFIKNAEVAKVYKLELTVKVPTGMTEADLARPVIQVKDFESDTAEYEIYTYGEETVVIPVQGGSEAASRMEELAAEQLEYHLQKEVDDPQVEWVGEDRIKLFVDESDIGQLIGKQGQNIDKIEERYGLHITVEPRSEADGGSRSKETQREIDCHLEESGNKVTVTVDNKHMGKDLDIYSGDDFLFSATVGKGGKITLTKESEFARKLLAAHEEGALVLKH